MRTACICLWALLSVPVASHAQTTRPRTPPPRTARQYTIRGFGDAGITIFSATQSFDAILGHPAGPLFGGGIDVGLTDHFFVSVSASRFRQTGHRAFVFQGQVFNLGIPTTITVVPLEFNGTYRFKPLHGVIPYLGGGIGVQKFSETSTPESEDDDLHSTHFGYQAIGGLEKRASKWIAIAAEAQVTSVPNALGKEPSGVSTAFNEHDLGGLTVRVKIAFGR